MSDPADRRAHPRVNIDAEVRVRPSGSAGEGIACRMRDASRGGVSVITSERPDADWIWVEILTASGQPVGDPLQAQVLRVDERPDGAYQVACSFDGPFSTE